jgi:hypothetical protein
MNMHIYDILLLHGFLKPPHPLAAGDKQTYQIQFCFVFTKNEVLVN